MPRPRKYSGPLLRGQRSVKQRVSKAKRGLNKVEKKQTTAIAKKVVNAMAETKYFNTKNSLNNEVPDLAWWTSENVKSEVSVYGYSTGYNRQVIGTDPAVNQLERYGQSTTDGSDITISALNLNKVFDEGENAIVGHSVRPSFNEVKWALTHMGITTDGNPYGAAPVQIRVIRVIPRAKKGSAQVIDPERDLFLDQYNQPFGIQSKDENDAFIFNRTLMRLSKVNSRRYIVKEDKMFTSYPSFSYSSVGSSGPDSQLVSTINNGYKLMTTKHNVGKELYYEDPTGSEGVDQLPDTGFQPEYIFYHLCAMGDVRNVNSVVAPTNFRLSIRPVSGFKDL